jgi:hypothetical protein
VPRDWKQISDDEILNFEGPQTAEIIVGVPAHELTDHLISTATKAEQQDQPI